MEQTASSMKWFEAPLSSDVVAENRRQMLGNNWQRLDLYEAQAGKAQRPIRILVPAIYDLLNFSHARRLMQLKTAFNKPESVYLIAGTYSDDDIAKKMSGIVTVNNQNERTDILQHCRYVDEVMPCIPFILKKDFLDLYKIDVVVHFGDSVPENLKEITEGLLWKLPLKKDKDGMSTLELIRRIFVGEQDFVNLKFNRNAAPKKHTFAN